MGTVTAARQTIQAFSRVMIPPPGPVRIFQKNLASQVRSDQEVLEISRNRIRRYWTSRRSNQGVFKPRGSFFFFFLSPHFSSPAELVRVLVYRQRPTFWTSRGHRWLPFSPPVLAFIFIAHRVQSASPLILTYFHRNGSP